MDTNQRRVGTADHAATAAQERVLAAQDRVAGESRNDFALAGFSLSGAHQDEAGISMVYLVDKATVTVGERLTLTAWILNATAETLTNVCLTLRSLTNARMDRLLYATQPDVKELGERTLGPRQSLQYTFSYIVTAADTADEGLLISALMADLTSSAGRLHSECDAYATTISTSTNS